MTAELLAQFAGIILSLVFAYVPKVEEWYAGLESKQQAAIMAGALAVVAIGVFGLSCAQIYDFKVTCDKSGAVGLLQIFIAALITNQATYLIAVRPLKNG